MSSWSKVAAKANIQQQDEDDSFDDIEPELCLQLLRIPSVKNFSSLHVKLKSCEPIWLKEFVKLGGLDVLLYSLDAEVENCAFIDTFNKLECILCVKEVLNSEAGLEAMLAKPNFVFTLAKALDTNNTMIKKQVFELLSALCLYSEQGFRLAIDALENYKVTKGQRYRFSLIINELKHAEVIPYSTACLAFINVILISTEDFEKRVRFRNEFIGLGLLDILTLLRRHENLDEDLSIQLDVFEESRLDDDDEQLTADGVDLNSHIDVFHAVFKRVSNKPQASNLLNVLQSFLVIDDESDVGTLMWDVIEKLVRRAVNIETTKHAEAVIQSENEVISNVSKTIDSFLNDNEMQIEKYEHSESKLQANLDSRDSPAKKMGGKECNGLKPFSSSNSVLTSEISDEEIEPLQMPDLELIPELAELGDAPPPSLPRGQPSPAAPKIPVREGIQPPTPLPVMGGIPPPPPPPLPGMGASSLPGMVGVPPPPPPPPPLPGMAGVSPPPPVPGMGGIPPPPPVPGMGGIPPPPPVPGMGGIPPPPPLPGMGGIPPPPPLPGMGGIPPPPPLPGMGGIPPPPPLPGVGGVPPPPPLPGIGGVPPPPPPPGMGGVPPPPPAPGIGGVPPPPPMFGGLMSAPPGSGFSCPGRTSLARSQSCPVVPSRRPSSKMRTLAWQKLPAHLIQRHRNSVWARVLSLEQVHPDFQMEEELFCQRKLAKKRDNKKKAPKEITLLDAKRSLNLNIFLKQFKKSNSEIVNLIRKGDVEKLEPDVLKSFLKQLPDNSEEELLKSFTGDKKKLGSAEKFLMELISVERYHLRVEGMLQKAEFKINFNYLKPNICCLQSAIKDILQSDILPEVLQLILIIGNFMNSGGYAGNATGIKITSLVKLVDTRANKPRMNLMHFLVHVAEEKREGVLRFPDQMKHLEKATRLSFDYIIGEVSTLKKNVESLEKQLKNAPQDIQEQCCAFVEEAKQDITTLEEGIDEINVLIKKLAQYFCEDESKLKIQEVLVLFKTFCDQLTTAKKENEQFRIQEKKRKERERRKKEEEARRAANPHKVKGKIPEIQEEGCIVDRLLNEIRGGFKLKKTQNHSPSRRRSPLLNKHRTKQVVSSVGEFPNNSQLTSNSLEQPDTNKHANKQPDSSHIVNDQQKQLDTLANGRNNREQQKHHQTLNNSQEQLHCNQLSVEDVELQSDCSY